MRRKTVPRALGMAIVVGILCLRDRPAAQPIPVSYSIRLASATVYDTRSHDEDVVHAALAVFVNGEHKASSVWDGKGWDGSRIEGRRWVTGLHLFGTPTESSVQVATGRIQDSDTVQVVFDVINAATVPTTANHESALDRIQQSMCAGGDTSSGWDCLAPQAPNLLAGWSVGSCDGLVAADKLVFPSLQLRRKTEIGDTITLNNVYRASDAPVSCGNSIYGVVVTIARQ